MNLPIASNPVVPSAEELVTNFEEAVHLETVSVRYRVPSERVRTFKEYFIRRLKGEVQMRTFWVLQDVTLDIYRGEVFGLVGVNGAGKSTLLKVVARVLRPTKGRVIVKGRVAPLLELGAGFHPELIGEENIFLNGVCLVSVIVKCRKNTTRSLSLPNWVNLSMPPFEPIPLVCMHAWVSRLQLLPSRMC